MSFFSYHNHTMYYVDRVMDLDIDKLLLGANDRDESESKRNVNGQSIKLPFHLCMTFAKIVSELCRFGPKARTVFVSFCPPRHKAELLRSKKESESEYGVPPHYTN